MSFSRQTLEKITQVKTKFDAESKFEQQRVTMCIEMNIMLDFLPQQSQILRFTC